MAKKKAHLKRSPRRALTTRRRAAAPKTPAGLALPQLAANEFNAGLVMTQEGKPSHWLIDVPIQKLDVNHAESMALAAEHGMDLPEPNEQSLLMANAGHRFEKRYYWSKKEVAGYSDFAYVQGFGNGYQYDVRKGGRFAARLVRRVPV